MGKPARILVTGADGFVGGWLMRHLRTVLPPDTEITATSRRRLDGASLDIVDAAAVDAFMAALRPTAVIHLAAVSSSAEARSDARLAWDVNLRGTLNLAEAVMRHAPEARFLYAGSSEAYGRSFSGTATPLDERAALNPRNVYAATKAAADLMLGQMAEDGLRAIRFRPFNHTGPGQSPRFVVAAFARRIAAIERGEAPAVMKVGNLDAQRDFLDVRDVAAAYALAIQARDLTDYAVYNLASGIPRRIGDVLASLLAASRARISIATDEALLRPTETPIAIGDARRAHDDFGWRPEIAWETTLRDVLEASRETVATRRSG
ncbi:MAG TPA: GDP-mannose 4,6-dehydratase [Lichenihabitans sp.]|nr:GDP-mannose 4,6-dehydratase [Lichenihabitans sp.]